MPLLTDLVVLVVPLLLPLPPQRLKMSYWLEMFHHKLKTHHEAQHNVTAAADAAPATATAEPAAAPVAPAAPAVPAVPVNGTDGNAGNATDTNATAPVRRRQRQLLRYL